MGGEDVCLGDQSGEQEEERAPSSPAEVVGVHPPHLVGALQRTTKGWERTVGYATILYVAQAIKEVT